MSRTLELGCQECGSLAGECPDGRQIVYADNNAIGAGIVNHVPQLHAAPRMAPGDMHQYVAPNLDRGPIAQALRESIAFYEDVRPEAIAFAGSGLSMLGDLPAAVGAASAVVIQNDFPGHRRAQSMHGVPIHAVPASPIAATVCPNSVAKVVAAAPRPITLLTYPMTNPGQAIVSEAVIDAALDANSEGIVVVDAAYRHSLTDNSDMPIAHKATQMERLLYMNVASKDLTSCGSRLSWFVANEPLLKTVRRALTPYPVAPICAQYVSWLARRPQLVRQAHAVQRRALKVFETGLQHLPYQVRVGPGPWAMVRLGDAASEYVERMARDHRVLVQEQTVLPDLKGWVRLSATVPCEARRVIVALHAVLGHETPVAALMDA